MRVVDQVDSEPGAWGQFAAVAPSPPTPPSPGPIGSPGLVTRRANYATCERCQDEPCKVFLKLKEGPWHEGHSGSWSGHCSGEALLSQGQELCLKCTAVYLLDVNFRFETTGVLGNCALLSDEHRDKRHRSSGDQPEAHRAQLSRSRSFMQTEHLCELCSSELVSFHLTRMVPGPSSQLPDDEESLELCPPCTARQCIASHQQKSDLVTFCEILNRSSDGD